MSAKYRRYRTMRSRDSSRRKPNGRPSSFSKILTSLRSFVRKRKLVHSLLRSTSASICAAATLPFSPKVPFLLRHVLHLAYSDRAVTHVRATNERTNEGRKEARARPTTAAGRRPKLVSSVATDTRAATRQAASTGKRPERRDGETFGGFPSAGDTDAAERARDHGRRSRRARLAKIVNPPLNRERNRGRRGGYAQIGLTLRDARSGRVKQQRAPPFTRDVFSARCHYPL